MSKLLNITRRDFVGGALIGSGLPLLGMAAPISGCAPQSSQVMSDPWTGYGGVGDYAMSNGNTAAVRNAAHLIRDGLSVELADDAVDTGEIFDMVIVGGGFSGLGAAYQFHKERGEEGSCLILENHPVFGGEAKQNEFDVDGYRLYGPQGSNGFLPPTGNASLSDEIFRAVGMPMEYSFVNPTPVSTKVKAPLDSYDCMYWGEKKFDTGYFYGDKVPNWIVNPWHDDLSRAPLNADDRNGLLRAFSDQRKYYHGADYGRWLDSMTYKNYLEGVMGLPSSVTHHLDPILAIADFGLSSDVISAYAAHLLFMPGTVSYGQADAFDLNNLPAIYSFPGGNTGYLRHIVKYLIPKSIRGGTSFGEILNNPIDFAALDKSGASVRIRLNSTVINVRHEGEPSASDHVLVTYFKDGAARRVRAKSVVMSIGGWVARRIVSDMPEHILNAYNEFHHGPVLVVNVALRNWRFLDALGISAARWFEGFGAFCSIRRPMIVDEATQPFDPEKPTVLTLYVPFNFPGHPIATQGSLGRHSLLSKSYADYEAEIIGQMNVMFAAAGFDAARDVAGIVLNRWGHAYIAPQPGFYFGQNGAPAPKEVVKEGFGRIQFGHSELGARMNYRNAIAEGGRASKAALAFASL